MDSPNDDLYFDDFTSKHFTIDEIINEESAIDSTKSITLRDTYYFVEELIDNFVPYFKIPFDYKIFLLKGVPKLILQISRNINHYIITLFDGNFMPLKEGRDWFINHDVAEVGIPIIPPSAFSMLKQSIMMANDVDDKYVHIDWFDDGSKPVFGEFTFATGASYTGMFALSDEIIANLDISLTKEYFTDYQRKGYRINTKSFLDSLDSDISHVSLVFNELIGKASLGNLDSMLELSTYFEKLAVDESDSIKKKLYQHLAICWEEVLLLYDDKHTEKLCRQINASWGFIFLKTFYFYQRIVEAKNALYNIGQKSDWYKVRCAQFMLDFNLDGQDKLELIECVRDLANDGFHYASVVKDKYQL